MNLTVQIQLKETQYFSGVSLYLIINMQFLECLTIHVHFPLAAQKFGEEKPVLDKKKTVVIVFATTCKFSNRLSQRQG